MHRPPPTWAVGEPRQAVFNRSRAVERESYRLPNASSTSPPSNDALFGAGETLSTCHISRTLQVDTIPL
eukprot:scaffold2631_cov373-Pavlova_lutheri.AAC.2